MDPVASSLPPPPPPTAPDPGGPPKALWWLTVLFTVMAAGAYAFFVRTGVGQRLDEAGFLGRDDVRPDIAGDAESLLGGIEITVLLAALIGVGVMALWRGGLPLALAAGGLVVGANLTTQVLKDALTRPHLIPDGYWLSNSFPSGHVTAVASLALAVVLLAPRSMRPVGAALAATLGTIVGLATVVAGWHRPSDVVGAWLVVGAWTACVAAVYVTAHRIAADPNGGRSLTRTVLWIVGGIAAAVYLAAATAWVLVANGRDAALAAGTAEGLAVTAGVSGMVAAALLVPVSIISAINRFSLGLAWPADDAARR